MPLNLVPPRPPSPNWRIRGTYLRTKVDKTAGTPKRAVAAKVLERIAEDIERGTFGKEPEPAADFMTATISYLEAGGERRFIVPLQAYFGEKPIDDIDQPAIDAAAAALYPNATVATRNRQVYTPMSAILKHAGREKGLRRPKGARGRSRLTWLTPERAFALMAAANARNARFGALCTFLLYTGCRLGEALRLQRDDLDLTNGFAFVGRTKNGQPRGVHLPPLVVAVLANLPTQGRAVFGFSQSGRLRQLFAEVLAAARIEMPERVAFHVFRHTYGAWMRRHAGLDTSGLVATGAWQSHDAARVYEHVEVSEEARKADLLPTPPRSVKSV